MGTEPKRKTQQRDAEKIRQHGAETYPHECCGALLGRDSILADASRSREIVAPFPLVNRRDDSPRNRFSVTSEDVRDAEKAARKPRPRRRGLVSFASGSSGETEPIRSDHAWPWYSYIIVSVANGEPQYITSWRLSDDRSQFTPEDLEIRERAAV